MFSADLRYFVANKNLLEHACNSLSIIEEVSKHEKFDSLAYQFKGGLKEHMGSAEGSPFRVTLVSTLGCHRSVAAAIILKAYCEKTGYGARIEHLSESSWGKTCRSCDFCKPSRFKDKLISTKVLEMMV